jgi:protein-S-isoprenylcysteine O-methyltransferase Ste14
MVATIQYFSVFFFTVYILVIFVWPSIRTYRQTGIIPLTFGSSDNAHDFIGRRFKVLIAAMAATIAIYCLGEEAYTYLLPASYLQMDSVQTAGMLLCTISLSWTAVAQYQMGRSWRIGIDEKHRTELKTTGLFSISRNPVFLGLLVTLLGFFLLLPNALTLLYLIAGYLLIQIQIRLEEEFLEKQHGSSYQSYKLTVRRLL